MVRVKICGITDLEEANMAIAAGADAIGFVFAKSRRKIHPEKAREISLALPPFISRVGVFVNSERFEVQEIASFCNLDTLQFHGDEAPEYCQRFSQHMVKAIPIRSESSLNSLAEYKHVHAFLLDTFHPNLRGGTGETFNWKLAVKAKECGRPIILAGGLTAKNIREAVVSVKPYAVDVSSSVEDGGRKSKIKLTEFFNELRGSIDELGKLSDA